MASTKFLNLLTLFSVVALAVSLGPAPVAALATEQGHYARHADHNGIAKKRRGASNGRCKPRPSSSLSSAAAATTTPATTYAQQSSTYSPEATTTQYSQTPSSTYTPPAATTSPVTTHTGNGKVGFAWPVGDSVSLKPFVTDKTKFLYTWDVYKPKEADALGFEFIPQLWGGAQDKIDAFTSVVKAGYANYVLGFNEPQEPEQSNLTPQEAVDLWRKYIQPLKAQGYTLICPATSSNPNGLVWMQNFFKLCPDCDEDCSMMAIHYYDISAQGFIDYVNTWHTTFNRPIVVTEVACQNFNDSSKQCSYSDIQNFMGTITSWMDQQDFVVFYCYFGLMQDLYNVNPLNRMFDANNLPNELGKQFIGS